MHRIGKDPGLFDQPQMLQIGHDDRFRARERWFMQRIRLRFSARAAASAQQIDAGGEA